MNTRDVAKYEKLAKESAAMKVPVGHVYVGYGKERGSLPFGSCLAVRRGAVYTEGWETGTFSGTSKNWEYACPKRRWEELVYAGRTKPEQAKKTVVKAAKKVPVAKSKTVEEVTKDLAKAKQLIGKRISVATFGDFVVGAAQLTLEPLSGMSLICEDFFNQNKYCIVLFEKNGSRSAPYIEKDVKIEGVSVRGYLSEEFKNHYTFGCAKISKQQLKQAKDFLEAVKANPSTNTNREIECVKIGAGEFTLEILKQLNLD